MLLGTYTPYEFQKGINRLRPPKPPAIAVRAVRLKNDLMKLGLFKSAALMDAIITELDWELARRKEAVLDEPTHSTGRPRRNTR